MERPSRRAGSPNKSEAAALNPMIRPSAVAIRTGSRKSAKRFGKHEIVRAASAVPGGARRSATAPLPAAHMSLSSPCLVTLHLVKALVVNSEKGTVPD